MKGFLTGDVERFAVSALLGYRNNPLFFLANELLNPVNDAVTSEMFWKHKSNTKRESNWNK